MDSPSLHAHASSADIRRRRRCRALPPPNEAELAAMLAAYKASGGQVTVCPERYALPVQNCAGRDGERVGA